MRRAAKVDENQKDIVDAIRACGCSVAITSAVGAGFPDLVVGVNGKNLMLEVKDGDKPASRRRLTDDQKAFHDGWQGRIHVVNSVAQAVGLVNRYRSAI